MFLCKIKPSMGSIQKWKSWTGYSLLLISHSLQGQANKRMRAKSIFISDNCSYCLCGGLVLLRSTLSPTTPPSCDTTGLRCCFVSAAITRCSFASCVMSCSFIQPQFRDRVCSASKRNPRPFRNAPG